MKQFWGEKVIILLFVVFIGTIFTGCAVRYIFNNTNTLKEEDAKVFTVEKTKVAPISKIDISTSIADIELIQSDDYYVEIDYTYWEDAPKYTIENGVLYFDDSDAFPNSYSINFNMYNSVKVYLPKAAAIDQIKLDNASGDVFAESFMAEKLDINVAYGDLSIENASATECDIRLSSGTSKITDFSAGKVKYSNSYGSAKFTNINTGDLQLPGDAAFESFNVSMSSGNIDIKGLHSISTEFSNSYGNITCKEISSEEFDASLSSGNLDISKADLKDINVSNSYGDITLSLNMTKADYAMDLDTSYGEITVDGKSYEDHLILENGGSRNIDADLSSGDVSIEFE